MNNANIDPITLTVVWNRLISIAEEMGSTLRRTAFSETVREGDDFSIGVFDTNARLVAQGNFTQRLSACVCVPGVNPVTISTHAPTASQGPVDGIPEA